jgi:hypothetical protein
MFVYRSAGSLEPKLVLEEKFMRLRHFEVKTFRGQGISRSRYFEVKLVQSKLSVCARLTLN